MNDKGEWNCKNCRKPLSKKSIGRKDRKVSGFCRDCYSGPANHSWSGGKPKCIDCKKQLTVYNRKRCKKCFHKFYRKENTYLWKGGLPKCFICKKELPNRYATYCKKHRPYKSGPRKNCLDCGEVLNRNAKYHNSTFCGFCVFKGKRSIHWKGGITPLNFKIRNSFQYKEWRTKVFKRDNWTCVNCGERNKTLQVDHIKPFSLFPDLRLEISNGRVLCKPCHKKIGWRYQPEKFVKIK